MSEYKVRCDVMDSGWNYDFCWSCKRFTCMKTPGKPRVIRCSLNKATAAEKRSFSTIWNVHLLISHGYEIEHCKVIVEYVGKKKRRTKPPMES